MFPIGNVSMSSKSIDFPPAARISCVYARRCTVCLGITQKAASSIAAARTAAHFLWLINGAKNTNLCIYIISCIVFSGCLHKGASKQKLGHFWQKFFLHLLFSSLSLGIYSGRGELNTLQLEKRHANRQSDDVFTNFQPGSTLLFLSHW